MPGFLFMDIMDFEGDKPLSEPAQPPATTAFARSRLPRSLLIAHYAVAGGCIKVALIDIFLAQAEKSIAPKRKLD